MRTLDILRGAIVTLGVLSAGGVSAQSINGADYQAAKERIGTDFKSAQENCERLAGNAQDICEAEAKGKQRVSEAELDYRRTGALEDSTKVDQARADAAYDVAKEMCDDRAGNEKEVCLKEAKAAQVRAKADAKVSESSATSRREAAGDKREADYELALKRCDAYAGNAKSQCVSAAKSRYGK